MPTYGGDEVNAVVLDVGSTWTRAGFAGEDLPRGYFPSHVGRVADTYHVGDTESSIWRADMETLGVMEDGVVKDWDVLERLWEHSMKHLHATASEHPLLVSEAAWSSSEQRGRSAELAFEKLGSPAFYTCKAPVMAAFGTGKHTALVLDVGGENSSASAVFEGFNLAKSVCHQQLGGEHVSRQLLDRLKTDYSYEPTPLFDIKHKAAVEIRKPPSITRQGRQATGSFMCEMRLRLMLEFKEAVCEVLDRPLRPGQTTSKPPKPFEFPDGFNIAAGPDLRYSGPELLFNPSQLDRSPDQDKLAGVHELVVKSIMACDIDLRPHLLNSIVLAGGSTLFPGFADRLSLALQEMCPGSRVKLHSPSSDMERKTSAWLGGSILASLGTFHQLWISKAEYEEHGAAIMRRSIAGTACLIVSAYWALHLAYSIPSYSGTTWPYLLLPAAGCCTSLVLGLRLLLIPAPDSKPVRRPPGAIDVVDNRFVAGWLITALWLIQAKLLAAWWFIASNSSFGLPVQAQVASFAAVSAVACMASYAASSSRTDYIGLFPWPLPLLSGVQALVGAINMYRAFFTLETRNVPMFGFDATAHANLLTLTTLLALATLFAHGLVQHRAMFVRANNAHPVADVLASDERTPLARRNDLAPSQLLDTPEPSASWFSKLTFSWPSDLLRRGARQQLDACDLYSLSPADDPMHNWKRYLRHRKPGRRMIVTIMLTFAPELFAQALLAIASAFVHFAGPFFLQRILRTIEKQGQDTSMRQAYLDAVGLLVFTLCETTMSGQSLWIGRHIGMRIKGLMVAELSAKTLRRRGGGSWEEKDSGDDTQDSDGDMQASADGKIMNLMTADLNRISEVMSYLDELYAMPLSLAIGIWYLYILLGPSAIVGLSVAIVYVPLSKVVFQYATRMETRFNSLSDERVAAITELLQGIKAVKLFGWEQRFLERINEKRERQLGCLWRLNCAWLMAIGVTSMAPMLVLVLIFTMYTVVFQHQLSAEIAFTSISVFQLVRIVFEFMPGMLSWAIGGYVSLNRIDSYLGQPEIQQLDERVSNSNTLGFDNACLAWDDPAEPSTEQTPLLQQQQHQQQHQQQSASISGFMLQKLNVEFPHEGMTIVAGPTGSGKSSLLAALVGEMSLVRGRVMVPVARMDGVLAIDDVAYVAQEAWLRNATIRENILFGEPYDAQRYESVLRACALKPDLRILRAGDATEIGERGVTLSGGQKQRVALARAVYSRRKILLIDDCLSAVDSHTAKHIMSTCLVSSSELMQGRTRVLVTHHVAACLPHASYVVLMRNGTIEHQGTPAALHAQGLLADAVPSPDDSSDSEEASATAANDSKSEDEYALERTADADGTLIDEEEREAGQVKASIWIKYFSACGGIKYWLMALAVMASFQLMSVLQGYWIRIWVASAGKPGQPVDQQRSPVFWMSVYVAIGFAAVLLEVAQAGWLFVGSFYASRSLHAQLLQAVMRATPAFFDSTPLGRIVNRFSRDMQCIDEAAAYTLEMWIADMLAVISVLAIITATAPAFLLVAVFVSVLYAAIGVYYLRTSRELKRLESNSMSPLLSLFGELIGGVTSIRAFGTAHWYVNEAVARIAAHNRPFYGVWSSNRWLSIRVDFSSAIVSFACALFVLRNMHAMDAGMAGFALSYALTFSYRMLWVIRNYSSNELNMNSVERIDQYLRVDQEAPLHVDNPPPATWPASGDVRIEDLVIEHVPGVPVLHGISLHIRHGEKIGVVGRTGAGKSTLSLALLRFIEAAKGQIYIDSIDIARVGLGELRSGVTIIPQDPVLFNGSIRFNLDPSNEYPDELIWDALKRAYLVRTGSGGSDQGDQESSAFGSLSDEIKENGQNLSLGQRQLVAIARALVRRSRLVILDEATASVDFELDSRIQRTIRGPEFADSSLLCIAHRLRTIIDYDRVLVLDKGRVAEFDTPWNLLHKPEGLFRSMCEQSGELEHLLAVAEKISQSKT
ncbi:hypothetical protein H4R22_002961 [Coemansia sp. RSA 1290]|nr:hypothetical protein H4R22_002961 [Coemansia sp. RSA 1290]